MSIDPVALLGELLDNPNNTEIAERVRALHDVLVKGYRVVDDHAEIPLTKGHWAKVDLEDLDRVLNHKWHVVGDGTLAHPVAARAIVAGHAIGLSRFIIGLEIGDPRLCACQRPRRRTATGWRRSPAHFTLLLRPARFTASDRRKPDGSVLRK